MKNDNERVAQSSKNERTSFDTQTSFATQDELKEEVTPEARSSFIKKVTIEPGCITCGACEFISPEVFEVTDICRVKSNAPLKGNEDAVRQAALACPVNVIKIEEE
jgi:ferredoxin